MYSWADSRPLPGLKQPSTATRYAPFQRAAAGNAWSLSSDGYVGTYINLTQAEPVTFTLSASGTTSNGLNPDMMISIADNTHAFNVTSGSLSNFTYTTSTLAAGTYFVRTQLDNQTATQSPGLTVGSMTVSGTGVSVLNTGTAANALNAATTYATNYREGPGSISLTNANGIHPKRRHHGATQTQEQHLLTSPPPFTGKAHSPPLGVDELELTRSESHA